MCLAPTAPLFIPAWGNAPGIWLSRKLSAASALQSRVGHYLDRWSAVLGLTLVSHRIFGTCAEKTLLLNKRLTAGRSNRRFKFNKSGQLFIRVHNVRLSVVAMCVSNPDCLPAGMHG